MLIKYGKGTKKFRFPVDLHLKQAVGALTLHTGDRAVYLRKPRAYSHMLVA